MNRSIALAFAALLLASPAWAQSAGPAGTSPAPPPISPPASDAAKQTLGVIASVDAVAGSVTLASGETFMLPMDVKATDLEIGSRVRIAFETDARGLKVATAVSAIVEDSVAPAAVPVPGPSRPATAGAQ